MPQPYFDAPPKVTLSVTEACNLACRFCYGDCGDTPHPRELDTAQWLRLFDQFEADGVIQVYIEGGEPLQRPDALTILEACGYRFMTSLRTHGTLIDAALAARLVHARVGRVLVNVMGATPGTHDGLTGVAGSHARSCAAVRHCVDAGLATDMLIILNRENVGELGDYLDLAHELGASRVGVLRLYPLGRARRAWRELSLSLDEQMRAIQGLEPPAGLELMQSWHPRDQNCCWQAATVNAFGDSIGCPYLREFVDFGNLRDTTLLHTWRNHPLYRTLRAGEVKSSCGECDTHRGTRGGCRASAYAWHGRWDAPDPFCPVNNNGVDLRELPDRLVQEGS